MFQVPRPRFQVGIACINSFPEDKFPTVVGCDGQDVSRLYGLDARVLGSHPTYKGEHFRVNLFREAAAHMKSTACPLCYSSATAVFFEDRMRVYRRCETCALVFVPDEYHLTLAEEKAEYDLHQNSPADERYRRFLNRLYKPLLRRLLPESSGLDFGSGPGPTLAIMFEEAGHSMTIYDPFYAPDMDALQHSYDFITASEVVEHLREPRIELERLWALLRPGGLLGLMTKRVRSREAFSHWHYTNDMTHISFFSDATFKWLERHWGAMLDVVGKDVVIFRKPTRQPC